MGVKVCGERAAHLRAGRPWWTQKLTSQWLENRERIPFLGALHFLILVYLAPQPMGRCPTHPRRVHPSQLFFSGNILTDTLTVISLAHVSPIKY